MGSRKDLLVGQTRNSFSISLSSAAELKSHFYVALDQKYVSKDVFDDIYEQADKVGKMDSNLITYLRESDCRYNETQKTRETK